MATTTKLADFLGRALTNINPGSSNATDFLGRAIGASDKDGLGRALVNSPNFPPAEIARNTAYSVGDVRRIPGTKEVQTLTATGTPSGNYKIGVDKGDGVQNTANIPHTANAAAVQAAVVALPNVEPGEVTVAGTEPKTFTWESELGNVPNMTVDNTGLTGGTFAFSNTTQGAVLEQVLVCTVAGTTHASNKPTPPAVGATVTDGTVTWKRLK